MENSKKIIGLALAAALLVAGVVYFVMQGNGQLFKGFMGDLSPYSNDPYMEEAAEDNQYEVVEPNKDNSESKEPYTSRIKYDLNDDSNIKVGGDEDDASKYNNVKILNKDENENSDAINSLDGLPRIKEDNTFKTYELENPFPLYEYYDPTNDPE